MRKVRKAGFVVRLPVLGLAVALASTVVSGTAVAQSVTPPPKVLDQANVDKWVEAHSLANDDWEFVEWTNSAAIFFRKKKADSNEYPTIRFWAKTELFSPFWSENKFVQSYLSFYEADCRRKRTKELSTTLYQFVNLKGEDDEYTEDDPQWAQAKPDTGMETLLNFACLVAKLQYDRDLKAATEQPSGFHSAGQPTR